MPTHSSLSIRWRRRCVSSERIDYQRSAYIKTMVHVFGKQYDTVGATGCGDDLGVPPGEAETVGKPPGGFEQRGIHGYGIPQSEVAHVLPGLLGR